MAALLRWLTTLLLLYLTARSLLVELWLPVQEVSRRVLVKDAQDQRRQRSVEDVEEDQVQLVHHDAAGETTEQLEPHQEEDK